MTNDETREMARLYRLVADLMDERTKLRDDYARVCGEANDFSAKWRATEQELARERTRAEKLEAEVGDWSRLADQRDAARRRAQAAEERVDELLRHPKDELLAAIPGVMEKVAKRIEKGRDSWREDFSGHVTSDVAHGFGLGAYGALQAVEYLRQHPKDALPEETP